jgi:phosphoglycolate phosphatase-like HAD superfamily hydrolase
MELSKSSRDRDTTGVKSVVLEAEEEEVNATQTLLHGGNSHTRSLQQSPSWGVCLNCIVYMFAGMSAPATMASSGYYFGTLMLTYSFASTYYTGELLGVLCKRFPEALDYYATESAEKDASFASKGIRALPGVAALLEMLHQHSRRNSTDTNVIVALCTGNLEPIGWLKMQALGLKPFFTAPALGGFGSDYWGQDTKKASEDRAQLLRVARQKAEASLKKGESPTADIGTIDRHVHVGDSPFDIKAAELAEAVPLGVTTGVFSEQELREVSSTPGDIKVLDSLANGPDTLAFILGEETQA